eukprot:gene27875-34657_t
MVAVLAINFSLIHAAPGDPASVIAGEMGGAQALKAAPVLSPWREAWRVFRGNKAAMLGLVSLILIMLIMLVGPAWYAVDPFGILR